MYFWTVSDSPVGCQFNSGLAQLGFQANFKVGFVLFKIFIIK